MLKNANQILPRYEFIHYHVDIYLQLVWRLSEILLETRSARSKILAVKLARSLKLRSVSTIGDGDQVQACSKVETRSARSKIMAFKTRSLAR